MKHTAARGLGLVTLFLFLLSCSEDRPVDSNHSSNEAVKSSGVIETCTPTTHNVSTTAQWDSVWSGLCDGDVIRVAANTTLTWDGVPGPACSNGRFCAINASFTIEGVDSTSKIVVTNPGGKDFLHAQDNGSDGPHTVTIRNIKLVRGDAGAETFISASGYDHVVIDNVVMDLLGQSVVFKCKTFDVNGLDFEASGNFSHGASNASLEDGFNHTIQNSKFRKTTGSQGLVQANFGQSVDGTILWENNVISSNGGAGNRWYSITGTLGSVDIEMTDNDFKKRKIQIGGISGSISFDMNCNNSNLAVCPDTLFTETGNNGINYSAPSPSWRFNYGACPGPTGAISAQNACIYGGFVYMEFTVTNTSGIAPNSVSVQWADDNCTTGATNVAAWYNSSTGKWNCSFDISAIEDGSFYWQGKAQYCNSVTASGTCQIRTTRECDEYPDNPPVWFTEG